MGLSVFLPFLPNVHFATCCVIHDHHMQALLDRAWPQHKHQPQLSVHPTSCRDTNPHHHQQLCSQRTCQHSPCPTPSTSLGPAYCHFICWSPTPPHPACCPTPSAPTSPTRTHRDRQRAWHVHHPRQIRAGKNCEDWSCRVATACTEGGTVWYSGQDLEQSALEIKTYFYVSYRHGMDFSGGGGESLNKCLDREIIILWWEWLDCNLNDANEKIEEDEKRKKLEEEEK